jgi:TRAP-type C4-dicarboxylate transport system substrate-binding protein
MTTWKVRPLAAALIVLSAIMLSGPAAPPLVAQSKPPITLRLTWNTSMDNHIGRGAQHFAKRANELTGGQVTIRLFPNAGLGSEQQALEGMQAGTVDMGYITVYTNAVKLGVVLDLPFLFRDFAHWKKAVDGMPGRTIAEAAPAAGLRVLAWHIGGWRDVYGSRPLRTVDDFKGLKLRTQPAVAIVEFFKAIKPFRPRSRGRKRTSPSSRRRWTRRRPRSGPCSMPSSTKSRYAVETHHAQATSRFWCRSRSGSRWPLTSSRPS